MQYHKVFIAHKITGESDVLFHGILMPCETCCYCDASFMARKSQFIGKSSSYVNLIGLTSTSATCTCPVCITGHPVIQTGSGWSSMRNTCLIKACT